MVDLLSNTFVSAPIDLKVLMLFWTGMIGYYIVKENIKKQKNV